MKTKNLAIILGLFFILSISLVQAVEIEPGKQGEDKLLYQTCNNCTFCNVTSVTNEVGLSLASNSPFVQDGTYYSIVLGAVNTTTLGKYTYCYDCGNEVDSQTGCIDFKVTPAGRDGNENIALFIIMIVMIYAITLISFFGKNIQLSLLTGMLMTFFGVYIIRNGIVIYRDNLTNYFGYVTIFFGALVALWAALAWIEDAL